MVFGCTWLANSPIKKLYLSSKKNFRALIFSNCDIVSECISSVYLETQVPFIVIIDEYDVLARDNATKQLFEDYLKLLNAIFKSSSTSSCIALAYLTGILPIVRDKFQSKLNNFDEYTIFSSPGMAGLIGFTEEETEQICKDYSLDYQECRRWYNGYVLNGVNLYAPKSVVTAAKRGKFNSYWTQTPSYEAILDYIKLDFKGIREDIQKMISGEEIDVNISIYSNTANPDDFKVKDNVFAYLVHLGYLAYNEDNKTCRIPNYEVKKEWINAIQLSPNMKPLFKLINESKSILEATWGGDGQAAASLLSKTHQSLTSPLSYNNERSFQSAIRLAYIYADSCYTVVSELPTGKGFADIAFIPFVSNIPAMIVELKVNGSANTAIDQIKQKNYPQVLEKYRDNLLLVAISYDRKTKEHECRIDKL